MKIDKKNVFWVVFVVVLVAVFGQTVKEAASGTRKRQKRERDSYAQNIDSR